ncbi:SMI1/KNR4 family protein [Ktedonosporobacter rubrisoli]|uniref:SMI1/KNR4 family protein n=1 Tax=Ktedonosporobacter rubrisoli TaxID=2509675 RepID=A0A4P6JIP2_KTERU|nr:SMI1/KNR4 family protein [Ktedonosporobacter rubrisoli]QBD74780.1 SMI1/KNR4 family protein [Ktedonosporobacter rubrisoli]
MANSIPQHFDEAFLRWFQERTELAWQSYQTRTFEDFVASGVGGRDWQQGTCWSGGLSEQEIVAVEQRFHTHFPPDYRLFLQQLHSVDRLLVGARYADDNTMIPITAPSFYHWQRDTEAIEAAYAWLVKGLYFDVQHANLWPQSWGAKPASAEAQEARVRELVSAAPKLIPILGHRYLLAEPCKAGNPVLSIYQSDMVVYGDNLHNFFLKEFGGLFGVKSFEIPRLALVDFSAYELIPFWGEFL